MAERTGRIPESVIEEVLVRNDIVDIVGQYVELPKASGQNLLGLCPFHSEKTPSFSVSKSKQIYFCFGCKKGGNVFKFIQEMERCSFPEAVRILAEKSGVAIPEPEDDHYKAASELRAQVRAALLEAARYFYRNFSSAAGDSARNYLQKRGISSATAKRFGLGYAPAQWKGLYQYLKNKGFQDTLLAQSGLFTKRDNGELLDLFRDRLMFPIFNESGQIIAFGGRILSEGTPKYINSPESPVYSKQKILYALNFAKKSKEKKIIVAEGYMDVISMHQAGLTNAVAPLGTAFTPLQLNQIARYTDEIVFFFDSDKAGQTAAVRSLQMLLQKNKRHAGAQVRISVARVPNGKDPDEYIQMYGVHAMKELIWAPYSAMDYLMLSAKEQSTVEGHFDLQTYQSLACTYLAWESNQILRENAAHTAAEVLNVSVSAVLAEVERMQSNTLNQEQKKHEQEMVRQKITIENMAHKSTESANIEEIRLLCLLTELGDLYAGLENKVNEVDFSSGTMREIAAESIRLLNDGKFNAANLVELCKEKQLNARSAEEVFLETLVSLESSGEKRNFLLSVQLHILQFQKKVYRKRMANLSRRLDEEQDEQEKNKLMQAIRKLDVYLKEITDQINKVKNQ